MASPTAPTSLEVPPGIPGAPPFAFNNPNPVRFLDGDLARIAKERASRKGQIEPKSEGPTFTKLLQLSERPPPEGIHSESPVEEERSLCPSYKDSSVESVGSILHNKESSQGTPPSKESDCQDLAPTSWSPSVVARKFHASGSTNSAPHNPPNTHERTTQLSQDPNRHVAAAITLRKTLQKGETAVSPRQHTFAWFSLLKRGDRHAIILSEDGSKTFLLPEEIPKHSLEFNSYFNPEIIPLQGGYRNELRVYLCLSSSKLLKENWNDNKEYKAFLKDHHVFPRVDEFRSTPTTTIGFIAEAHPRLTHLLSFKSDLRSSLEATTPDPSEKSEFESSSGSTLAPNQVPTFSIFRSTRIISPATAKTKTEVIVVRCARRDRRLLSHLMCKALSENRMPQGFFVPTMHHSPEHYSNILKGHATNVANMRSIPIIGFSKEAAETITCNDNGKPHLFVHALSSLLKLISIQPTMRTSELGKWLVVVHKEHYEHAVFFIDSHLPTLFRERIPPYALVNNFPFPRRSSRTITATTLGRHATRLMSYATAASSIPMDNLASPKSRKARPVVRIEASEEDFPPLPTKKQRHSSDSSSSKTTAPSTLSSQTRTQDVDKAIAEMESRNIRRIKESEEKTNAQIVCVVKSKDQQIDSLSKSIDSKLQKQLTTLSSTISSQVGGVMSMIKELTLQLQDLKSSHSSKPVHQSSTQPTPMLVDQVQREPRKDNSSRPRKHLKHT